MLEAKAAAALNETWTAISADNDVISVILFYR
jgi:hypothetical protein